MKYHLKKVTHQFKHFLLQFLQASFMVLLFTTCGESDIEDRLVIAEDFEATIEEDIPAGTVIGALSVSDLTGQGLTYVLESQSPDGALTVDPETGTLTISNTLVFSGDVNPIRAVYSAFTQDGNSDEANITITLVPSRDLVRDRNSFITTWRISEANEEITIPTFPGLTYNYDIDWGDGTESNNQTGNATHVYSAEGIYEVSISGIFPAIYFNFQSGRDRILTIEQWGNIEWTTMQDAFEGCNNLTYGALDVPDLSRVTNMANMFSSANSFNGFIDNWDVSNVTNMSRMFLNASSFNGLLNSWDVSNVTNMFGMFENARSFNQPLDQWEIGNVTSMSDMFEGANTFNQPIGSWDVRNVTNMNDLFEDATSFNQPLNDWDVDNVSTMREMFDNASSFNQPLDNWNVTNVSNMSRMFERASSFNQPLESWDVSSVNNMSRMFLNATTFNQNLSDWTVGGVTSCGIFSSNSALIEENLPNFTSCTP